MNGKFFEASILELRIIEISLHIDNVIILLGGDGPPQVLTGPGPHFLLISL